MKKFIMLIGILALMLGLFATEVVIGDGTLTQRFPLGSFYGYERSAALYTAAEIGPQNTKISAVSWYSSIATTAEVPTKIYMKTTSASSLTTDTWANMSSGAVLLYDSSYTGTVAGGWNLFTLTNDFNVDMGDNLMILVERNFGGGGSSSAGGSSAGGGIHSTALPGTHLTWNADNNPPTGNGTVAANRPNVTITYTTYAIDTPPFPAAIISPANGATLVSPSATLNWGSGGGGPTGYKVHFGTTTPPPFIQNTTEISYAPTLAIGTTYYWQIIPFNAIGDAVDCPVWSFSTHGDPTITALPYSQNWDAVPVPTLPFDWTKIVQSTNVGALVETYASASYVHSQPNCARLYNPSDADATLLLVGPPVAPAINIGSVRVKFWGRSSGAGYPLSLGVMTDPTDPATYTEVHNLAMTTTVTEYVFSMASYTGAGTHIAFKHGLGGTSRTLYVDDIAFEQIAPNDLACEALSGNSTPSVNNPTVYTASIHNWGTANQSTYTVKLFNGSDVELASAPGLAVAPDATVEVPMTWTPTAEGIVVLYAKVFLTGDINPVNDQSPELSLLVMGAGTIVVSIGNDTTTNGTSGVPTPYGTFYKNFRQQYLFTAAEILAAGGTPGMLTSIGFDVQAMNNCTAMPNYSIRLKNTDQSVLTTTFEVGDYTQVFYQNDFLPVEGWNTHPFTSPFDWDGTSNLLVDIVTSIIPGSYAQNASVYYTATTGVNTCLRYQNDSVEASTATTGTLSVNRANVRISLNAGGGTGALNGTVTAGGNPLSGATVTVAGTPLTYTTTDTGAFNFPTVDAGTYNVTASMTGFNSQTLPVTVVSNGTSTLNFVLTTSSSVSEYSFTSAVGTYTQITTGTVLGTSTNDQECFNAIPLGFAFNYNGAAYTEVSVMTNGFLAMGSEVLVANLPISSATASNNVVSAMTRDLKSRDSGELSYLLNGTAPNRVFTVQWKDYRRAPTTCANDIINFQIQLHEDGNKVVFAYGNVNTVDATTAQTVQVGLRGNDNTSFNNRTTTESWIATTAGTANNASCRISSTVFPPNGLVFTFSPAQQGTPPNPAQNPIPANNAVNVAVGTNLSWSTGGGNVDGYKLYFGTNNPPTNLVNGATQTGTVYDHPTNLVYSTPYYWKVVPFNADFEAPNCPVWQFTTLADPTITTYPYVQNFDAAAPPALPLGWSAINANADAYTWETYAGNADTAPNSARIRYSTTVAMDDWLLTPPMNMVAGSNYLIKFSYRANSATYPEVLSVYTGTAPNAAGLTNQIFTNTNITNATYEQAQIVYTPTANGTYYIGFHGHSPANMFYLYLDTFSIEELTDVIDPPTNLTANVINNTYVALDWDAPGETPPPPPGFNDGFETYTNFAIAFDPWVMVDVDQSTTYGMTGTTWLNGYAPQAFMVFNPSATTPPLADPVAHGGAKMAACFAAVLPAQGGAGPNNDWMISPLVTPTAGQFLNFYAKSYTAEYGLERFKVGISTTGATTPASFTIISGANYIQAPAAWTLYSYDLSSYAGQNIRFGIQCVSSDAFIFLVDDVSIGAVPTAKTYASSQPATGIRNTGTPVSAPQILNPPTREFLGYKVYRNGTLLTTIANTATTAYEDHDVTVGTYSYTVTAFYSGGESTPAGPVTATINPPNNPPTGLTAAVAGNDVTLNWVSPETPATGEWITWCQDVLGNGIGTNSPIIFDVAHRFTQTDLAAHQGGAITQVKFVPNYADCVYTVKVWTGGSATNAGNLVSSQIVPNITLADWNLVILNTPVTIPSTGDLYVGFEVNTQGDHPAGCDNGPVIEGKGNMMYFEGAWTTLTALAASLTYNWSIKTFVADGAALKAIELVPIAEHKNISYATAPLTLETKAIARTNDRALAGFKVYRDNALIGTINDPQVTTFSDMDLPNGTYVYGVTAVYTTGESAPATVNATVNVVLAEIIFQDDFDSYANFALLFAPWTMVDVDLSPTYGISNVNFPGSAGPMAYIIFNPSATVPPITSLTPHSGAKMAASFAAVMPAEGGTGPNNDWMITPRLHMGTNSTVKFYARSHTVQYGMERFRVGVSMLPNIIPQGFQYVSPGDYVEAPAGWTEYIYDLSTYNNQNVYIGIRCVSNDAFVFYVDDFSVHSDGGYVVDNDDPGMPALVTELQGNYPNPFNPSTTIRYSVKEATPVTIGIYNVKGQLVKALVGEDKSAGNHSIVWDGRDNNNQSVSSGVYFYKMNAGKYSSTKKMIMMK